MSDLTFIIMLLLSLTANLMLLLTLAYERQYTIRRDPKTGRYIKKGR